jgi:glycosyltransferase involved in cell wall biosynthesis
MKVPRWNLGSLLFIIPAAFDIEKPRMGITEVMEIFGNELPKLGIEVTFVTPTTKNYSEVLKLRNATYVKVPRRFAKGIFDLIGLTEFYYRTILLISRNINQIKSIVVRDDPLSACLFSVLFPDILIIFQYSFPLTKEQGRNLRPMRRTYHIFNYFLMDFALKKSSLIFPISRTLKERLINCGVNDSKISILPMGVNPGIFSDDHYSPFEKSIPNWQNVNIVYVGSVAKARGLSILIEAFKECSRNHSNARLVIVGDGDDRTNLEEIVKRESLERKIIFKGLVSQEEVARIIHESDIGVSLVPPTDQYIVSSPTKVFEYMAMGKPVILNRGIVEQEDVSNSSHGCLLVDYDVASITLALNLLVDNKKMRTDLGSNGKKWVLDNRSYSELALRVAHEINKIQITK